MLPVEAPVIAHFAYSAARPFAAGQRRGADFAARAGDPVRAPCTGRVTYAGAVPARSRGVTLRCGRLTWTVLGLRATSVRARAVVAAGAPLGAAAGTVRVGARVSGRRFAYVDPLPLLRVPAPAPRPAVPLRGPRAQPPAPLPHPAGPRAVPPGRRRGLRAPLAAWLGAAVLAVGLAAGVTVPRARRTRKDTAPAAE